MIIIANTKLWQSINETNQESNQYLQLCRSETDCQSRIHFLLEVFWLQVRINNNFQRPKLSLLY